MIVEGVEEGRRGVEWMEEEEVDMEREEVYIGRWKVLFATK
jgi:hypothetical protein